MYNKSLSFDHAVRLRPKGYSVKVWEFIVSEAILNKEWAHRTIRDQAWIANASDASIEMLGEYLYKSVLQLSKESYEYFQHRAFGETYIGPLDPSTRRRWEAITGRKIPKAHYWLYDHRDQDKANKLKFNVKRGYGWLPKTKSELKRGA